MQPQWMNASSYTENIPHITSTNSYKPSNFIQTERFVLKMSAERRAALRQGSEVSLGDPNILDPSDEDVSIGVYSGTDEFKKAQRKGDFKPREGVYAVAGVGYTHMKDGNVEAVVKGPNIGLGASGSSDGARVFYNAEAISTSLSAGPAKATVALSANTGVDISKTQLEAKVLGTGVSFGRKMGFSLFGSGFEFELW